MAMLDYGALLRVDGNFINKNTDLFMERSDTGYVCKSIDDGSGHTIKIDGNYFVYAGDEKFLVVFYKGHFMVISKNELVRSEWNIKFESETFFHDGLPCIKVSHLDGRKPDNVFYEDNETWKERVKQLWNGATGNEKINELSCGKEEYKKYCRLKKKAGRESRKKFGPRYTAYPNRYIAEWDYDGRHYEVIFGYGIDPDESVWNDIKYDNYDFSEKEIQIIDSWFTR